MNDSDFLRAKALREKIVAVVNLHSSFPNLTIIDKNGSARFSDFDEIGEKAFKALLEEQIDRFNLEFETI